MPFDRETLRHSLATLAYRAGKALRDAPGDFGDFKAHPNTRTPLEILAHMGDLMAWGLSKSRGVPASTMGGPLPWDREVARFFSALTAWDAYLGSEEEIGQEGEKLFQGPIADALTHTGQLALLRGMAGSAVPGESYYRAPIAIGRTGFDPT